MGSCGSQQVGEIEGATRSDHSVCHPIQPASLFGLSPSLLPPSRDPKDLADEPLMLVTMWSKSWRR